MKKETIGGFIVIAVILSVVMFSGCVEEETISSPSDTTSLLPTNPKNYLVTYSTIVENDVEIDTLEIGMPHPYSCNSQKNIKIKDIQPAAYEVITDSEHGNNSIYWKCQNLTENRTLIFNESFYCTISGINSNINGSIVGQYNTADEQYILNTQPERFIEANDSQIIEVANVIVGNVTNPYNKAYLIYNWTLAHMEYRETEIKQSAKWALVTGSGDCWEYSVLFSALCRAEGIPTRLVMGYWLEGLLFKGNMDPPGIDEEHYRYYKYKMLMGTINPVGHVWVEVYIPDYGWIPVDASMGDGNIYFERFYFGNLDNGRVIFQKGGDTHPTPQISYSINITKLKEPLVFSKSEGFKGPITTFTAIKITPI